MSRKRREALEKRKKWDRLAGMTHKGLRWQMVTQATGRQPPYGKSTH
jgi:hypothetical protein